MTKPALSVEISKSPERATIDDVAAHAKVSTATVSRFLNNPAKVAPVTALRVEEAIAELGYMPHAAASWSGGQQDQYHRPDCAGHQYTISEYTH